MAVNSSLGALVAIGTTASATNSTEYGNDSYTTIGEVMSTGEFGDVFSSVTFNALASGRVRKFKGQVDGGDFTLSIGMDKSDSGQTALETALADTDSDDYNFRVTLTDGDSDASPVVNPTVVYFSGKVMSRRYDGLSADGITMVSVSIALNTGLTEVAAA